MISVILSFTLFALSQVGTPGPANMVLLSTGAKYGLKKAIPFVVGVIFGKQLIIWPIGFGLIGVISNMPMVFAFLKILSAAYILWLSYKIANLRLDIKDLSGTPPGFFAGLMVHPLNPKAWGMVITGYTSFISNEMSMLSAILTISIILLLTQIVLHPLWCWGGQRLALLVKGKTHERYLMWILASLTLISVFYALSQGF
ncbi:MAG: LysE family translocator [Paracoccaceae bacterium]|nr:LysE family translocator [Paracoccaceae bacterium]